MAQFSTLLPVLLLAIVFNPPVCSSSKLYSEMHDRARYMGVNGHSPQYLAESGGLGPSRLAEPTVPAPPLVNHQISQEELNDRIKIVFKTEPDANEYNSPLVGSSHINPYNDYMHADQPQDQIPSLPSLTPSSSTFKVQRSPSGKLNVVYDKDYVHSKDIESFSHNVNDHNNSNSSNLEKNHRTDSPIQKPRDEFSTVSTPTTTPKTGPTEDPSTTKINYSQDCVEKNAEDFCTNLRNYPESTHLEQIIKKKFSNLELFFGEDFVLPQNISQRMNNEPNEEFLCKSRTRVIYPHAGLNKDYNWLIIVNIPNYKQGIRIEECINEGSTCGESNGLMLPNHYTATCKQSYIYRSLVAYTNETVIRDQFKMPSCCKCVLKMG